MTTNQLEDGAFYYTTARTRGNQVRKFGVWPSVGDAVDAARAHNQLDYDEHNDDIRITNLFQARQGRLIGVALFTGVDRTQAHPV